MSDEPIRVTEPPKPAAAERCPFCGAEPGEQCRHFKLEGYPPPGAHDFDC
jgi:hypothetical protein